MKRTQLKAVLVSLTAIGFLTTGASAYYHPHAGRFMQRDPIDYANGMNLYEYLMSGPTASLDPTGLYDRDVHQDLTYALALANGYCSDIAWEIAEADEAQDHGFYEASVLRIRLLEWYEQTLCDLWHFPGAGQDPWGHGLVDRGSRVTQDMLSLLRDAAHRGGTLTRTINDYSRFPLPTLIPLLQVGWTETGAASYLMSTYRNPRTGQGRTTIDIRVYDRERMMGVFLHSMQDSYAHEYGNLGHPNIRAIGAEMFNNVVDLTWTRPRRARDMSHDTYLELGRFPTARPGDRPYRRTPWPLVEPHVLDFIRARRARDKENAYEAILRQVRLATGLPRGQLRNYSGYEPVVEEHPLLQWLLGWLAGQDQPQGAI